MMVVTVVVVMSYNCSGWCGGGGDGGDTGEDYDDD